MPGKRDIAPLLRAHSSAQSDDYLTSITTTTQAPKVISDMFDLPGGYDLSNWSFSARAQLIPSINITIKLKTLGQTYDIRFPKFALLAFSELARKHLEEHPEAKEIYVIKKDMDMKATRTIANWLRRVCTREVFSDIPVPDDLGQALKVRLTARTMGMHQYVEHIDDMYFSCREGIHPDAVDIETVVDNTSDQDGLDPLLYALVNRLSYLCRYHQVTQEKEIEFAELLKGEKFHRLLDAVDENEVLSMWKSALDRKVVSWLHWSKTDIPNKGT